MLNIKRKPVSLWSCFLMELFHYGAVSWELSLIVNLYELFSSLVCDNGSFLKPVTSKLYLELPM